MSVCEDELCVQLTSNMSVSHTGTRCSPITDVPGVLAKRSLMFKHTTESKQTVFVIVTFMGDRRWGEINLNLYNGYPT
jgi:hypothetical protein